MKRPMTVVFIYECDHCNSSNQITMADRKEPMTSGQTYEAKKSFKGTCFMCKKVHEFETRLIINYKKNLL